MPNRPPTHKPQGWQSPQARAKAYELARGSPSSRGYGRDWVKFRAGYLRVHPLCEDCSARQRITVAEELHHIIKPRDRPDLRLDPGNVKALCVSCHSTRTGRGE
jgi:5-methylcytosine-specific restriction protein A